MTVRAPWLGAVYFFALSLFLTWPLIIAPASIPAHHDTLFSIWRIAWIHHALVTGVPLFDANIFYPETRTLAYSDATLLQGVIAAPFIAAGLSPVLAYNFLVLASFVAGGLGTFIWARSHGLSTGAALVGGTVFAASPIRFDHYIHLELLWTQWIPLSFWATRRVVIATKWTDIVLLAACLVAQALSSIYCFLFLSTALLAYAGVSLLLLRDFSKRIAGRLLRLGSAAVLAALIILPYATPYIHNARTLGDRSAIEVETYSASPSNFLAAPDGNKIYGWTAQRWGRNELQLFPGILAVVLAVIALRESWRKTAPAWAVLLAGVDLTSGTNGVLFALLRDLGLGYNGLRVPARAAVLIIAALGLLAAFGCDRLGKVTKLVQYRRALVVALLTILLAEYWTSVSVTPTPTEASAYARWLRQQSGEVVAEFPLPLPDALPGRDIDAQYESIFHWQTLFNGYSGHYPDDYIRVLEHCRTWNIRCLSSLRLTGVTLVVLHLNWEPGLLSAISVEQLERTADIQPLLTVTSLTGPVRIYRIATAEPVSLRATRRTLAPLD